MNYRKNNTLFGEIEKGQRNLLGKDSFIICSCCGAKVRYSASNNSFILELDVVYEKKGIPMEIFQYVRFGRLDIGECCFPKLEEVVLERIEKIFSWVIKEKQDKIKALQKEAEEIEEYAKIKADYKRYEARLADKELQLLSSLKAQQL